LLAAAEKDGFDLFLTADKNIRYQQKLSHRRIALIVLGNSPWPLVRLHIAEIVAAVSAATPGTFVEVEIPLPQRSRSHDAKALSQTGILFFPPENYASHKIVEVMGHDAVLVAYQPGKTGQVAYNLSWTADGIAYSLFGRDPGTALAVAESLK
jgi:hypothetical protein